MLLSEAIEALCLATLADGRSERTAGDYRQKLGALLVFLGDVAIDQVTTNDLRRFVVDLRSRESRWPDHPNRPQTAGGLSPASVAGYVRCVKRLFHFLQDDGLLVSNPAARLKGTKPKRGEPKGVSREDLRSLLTATEGDAPNLVRNHAMILFLADTGCRVGGLVGLALAGLDLEGRTALLVEKGDKARRVPFSEVTRAALARWLVLRPAGGDAVFCHLESGARLDTQAVREVLRRLAATAKTTGAVNPHSFRHGFAREFIISGGDMGTLADILGHADIQTTWESYAIFKLAELQAKHEQHSPIAKMGREGEL
ncbi:MAG: tyrosine-type recombinase/integrase [Anaerolineae bacterium]